MVVECRSGVAWGQEQGAGPDRRRDDKRGRRHCGSDRYVHCLNCNDISWICTYVKLYTQICMFVVCKLHYNKAGIFLKERNPSLSK